VDCSSWCIPEENRPDLKLVTVTRGVGLHVEMAASSATNTDPNRDWKLVFLNSCKAVGKSSLRALKQVVWSQSCWFFFFSFLFLSDVCFT